MDILKERFARQAREDVRSFLNIKLKGIGDTILSAGETILRALLKEEGDESVDVSNLCAGGEVYPVDIASRVREKNAHAVIWHPFQKRYKIASDFQ